LIFPVGGPRLSGCAGEAGNGTVSRMVIEDGVQIRRMEPGEWTTVRGVRLAALADAPEAFASTLDRELGFEEATWRERIAASPWFLAWRDGEPVGLVAVVTQQPGGLHLVSMWVSPQVRGSGVADGLVAAVTAHARAAGVSTVTLWVATGNDRARGFYERMGFRSTGVRQTYQRADAPDLDEEELALDLAGPG
jgi:ribosomal protein S18 acetylase RimI-like enzyme